MTLMCAVGDGRRKMPAVGEYPADDIGNMDVRLLLCAQDGWSIELERWPGGEPGGSSLRQALFQADL